MLHARMLRYLDEVARAGSIRKAADRLNVSATAINRQILLFEEEIGTPMFQRLARGMRLTSAGEIMVGHIRQTLRDYQQAELRIEDLKGMRRGDVKIATMNGLAGGLLARAIGGFCRRYPRLRVTTQVSFIPEIVKSLVEGECDLALGYNLPMDPRLQIMQTFDASLGAVVASDHPLAGAGIVRPSDCLAYDLIFADAQMVMHQTVRGMFQKADMAVEPTFQSNSIEFMKALAVSGDGVAFLSRFDVAEEIRNRSLVFIPMADPRMSSNRLVLAHRAKRTLDRAASLLAETLRERITDMATS